MKEFRPHIRLRVLVGLLLALCLSTGCWWSWPPPDPPVALTPIAFDADDRILILSPHPDDEVLACGGIIQAARQKGVPVKVVFLTYGDNNEWSFILYRKRPVIVGSSVRKMGLVRHDEAVRADGLLGLKPEDLIFLGYPDFKVLKIWCQNWHDEPACWSYLTSVNKVPYHNALRPGTPYKGEEVLKDITTIIREYKPTKIFVSHPADTNPDHQALYCFLNIALWDMEGSLQPEVFPYLTHYSYWPNPRGYLPESQLNPPRPLGSPGPWAGHRLPPGHIALKSKALKKHRTQYNASTKYLTSFVRTTEIFADFPIATIKPETEVLAFKKTAIQEGISLPEDLRDQDPDEFVAIEQNVVSLENDMLVVDLRLSRALGPLTGCSVYLFGYRPDRAFEAMPKLRVVLGPVYHIVKDQNRYLEHTAVEMDRDWRKIRVAVPLELMGDPTRIFMQIDTKKGRVPLDWSGWRKLYLE
ncbi:PIG-L deacetylase family protein [Planctomycetota bacterium]